MTNSPTKPVAPLSEEALAEIERDLASSPLATFPMTTEQVAALCQTVRALRAENAELQEIKERAAKWIGSFPNGVSLDVIAENAALREQLAQAIRERDLAVAHDRQPYPTAEAYEKVCAALNEHKERLAQVEKERDEWSSVAEKYQALVARTERDVATRMREACVEKVRAMRGEWHDRYVAADSSSREALVRKEMLFAQTCAARDVTTALESLTLDHVEQEPTS